MWGAKVRHIELITVTTFEHEQIMQRAEAANERCSDNRDALKINFLKLYVRKVLFKIFKKYL